VARAFSTTEIGLNRGSPGKSENLPARSLSFPLGKIFNPTNRDSAVFSPVALANLQKPLYFRVFSAWH